MSAEHDEPMPLISLTALTGVYDLQTSLIDGLLGGPLDLVPAGSGELIHAGPDPELVIHPLRGTAQVQLGWTREQVEASLGKPDSTSGGRLAEIDAVIPLSMNYMQRGILVEVFEGAVSRITFHAGTYVGGLLGVKFRPYAGVAEPDLDLTTLTEAELRARLGQPLRVHEPILELSELLDERPATTLCYPEWDWLVYDDGVIESVVIRPRSS